MLPPTSSNKLTLNIYYPLRGLYVVESNLQVKLFSQRRGVLRDLLLTLVKSNG